MKTEYVCVHHQSACCFMCLADDMKWLEISCYETKRVKNWQISMFTSLDRASELHHHHKFLAGVRIPCPKAKKCLPQVIRCDPALLILLKTSSSAGAHRDSRIRVPTAKVGLNKDMDRCHMQLKQKNLKAWHITKMEPNKERNEV